MSRALRVSDHSVHCVSDGMHAHDALTEETYDLVILDLGLPRMDGLDLLRRLRSQGNPVPVLIVTARHAVPERVEGLGAGADDYLTKPFDLAEFEARVSALLRRRRSWNSLQPGRDDGDQESIGLTHREQSILDVLLARQGQVVTRDDLAKQVALGEEAFTENACQVHISRLRKKLLASGLSIRTVRGFGYMLRRNAGPTGKPD